VTAAKNTFIQYNNVVTKPSPSYVQNLYLVLTLISTLAASCIWGVNTLFLLSAGLSNTEAFLANTFFTIGQVFFEVPTGMVADLKGRQTSYVLGTATLAISTLLYLAAWYAHASLGWWAVASILLGLGFAFLSGATEAWLVDSLTFAGYQKALEPVFARAQMVGGVAMLLGSVGGGILAQTTGLSTPYLLRSALLMITLLIAAVFMKDWGYTPVKKVSFGQLGKELFVQSFQTSWRQPAIRWVMISGLFVSGVGFYAFYAMQPLLLQLYGDQSAYAIAGIAAAAVAGAQIVGSGLVPYLRRGFKLRTTLMIVATSLSAVTLGLVSQVSSFGVAVGLLCLWGLVSAVAMPIRQAYLNGLIPARQRATMLSFDSLVSSSGGAMVQPGLGRAADIWGYGASLAIGAGIQILALTSLWLARRQKANSDQI
jgi:MFS family permease